jgi:hypothetical protein
MPPIRTLSGALRSSRAGRRVVNANERRGFAPLFFHRTHELIPRTTVRMPENVELPAVLPVSGVSR